MGMRKRFLPKSGKCSKASGDGEKEATWTVWCCKEGHVHVEIDGSTSLTLDADGAYEFGEQLMRGYDFVVGLEPAHP